MSGLFSTVGSLITKALPWISAGVGLLSTVKSYQQARAVEKEGAFNSEVWQAEAVASWRAHEDKAMVLRDQQRRFLGAQRTNYAKSGVTLSGTPMTVLNEIVYMQGLDQQAQYNTAVADRTRRLTEATTAQWQAHMQGNAIRTQALSNFGATLINTAGRINYGAGVAQQEEDQMIAAGQSAPASKRKYTTAQANAVPGARGWRPLTAVR